MQQDVSPQPLEYAGRGSASSNRAGRACLLLARLCALGPMTVGVLILLLYWLTRWDPLPAWGLVTIIGGLGLLVVGFGCLVAHAIIERRAKVLDRRVINRETRSAMVLLLANLPLAWVCAAIGMYLMSQYHIVVVNQTDREIASGVVEYPGGSVTFGRLGPAERQRVIFRTGGTGSGQVVVHWADGLPSVVDADTYLSSMGGSYEWAIQPDRTMKITRR